MMKLTAPAFVKSGIKILKTTMLAKGPKADPVHVSEVELTLTINVTDCVNGIVWLFPGIVEYLRGISGIPGYAGEQRVSNAVLPEGRMTFSLENGEVVFSGLAFCKSKAKLKIDDGYEVELTLKPRIKVTSDELVAVCGLTSSDVSVDIEPAQLEIAGTRMDKRSA